MICTQDITKPELAVRTWSKTVWFNLAWKIFWRSQQLLHIPYLNVFSNFCYYDACLKILPGHDVVHERNGIYKMGVAMACRRLNIPYVFFFDADDLLEHDMFGISLSRILRWRAQQALLYNLKTAARVICVSNLAKSRLMGTWRVPQEKIVVLPNAVDVRFIPLSPEGREAVRKKFDMDDNPYNPFRWQFLPVPGSDSFIECLC